MSLLHCFAVTKEIAIGSGTSGILYKLFPNVIITSRGWDSYTACHFHKYGWPNNTSQTSRWSISHNTSLVKGLCCREVDTAGWRGDLILGEATRWCMAAGVMWSVIPTASRHLLKWGSFGSHYQQWTVSGNPLPTSGSGKDAPPPLNPLVLPFGSSW